MIYLVRGPFNAAIFDVGAAQRIIDRYGLERPIVGGHSLGGISACRFASANAQSVSGLNHSAFGDYGLQRDDGPNELTMDRGTASRRSEAQKGGILV